MRSTVCRLAALALPGGLLTRDAELQAPAPDFLNQNPHFSQICRWFPPCVRVREAPLWGVFSSIIRGTLAVVFIDFSHVASFCKGIWWWRRNHAAKSRILSRWNMLSSWTAVFKVPSSVAELRVNLSTSTRLWRQSEEALHLVIVPTSWGVSGSVSQMIRASEGLSHSLPQMNPASKCQAWFQSSGLAWFQSLCAQPAPSEITKKKNKRAERLSAGAVLCLEASLSRVWSQHAFPFRLLQEKMSVTLPRY